MLQAPGAIARQPGFSKDKQRRSSENAIRGPAVQSPLSAVSHKVSNVPAKLSERLPRPGSAAPTRPDAAAGTPGRRAPGLVRQRSRSADGSSYQPQVQPSRSPRIPGSNSREVATKTPVAISSSPRDDSQSAANQGLEAGKQGMKLSPGVAGAKLPCSPFSGGVASGESPAAWPAASAAARQPSGRPPLARKPLPRQRSISLDGAAALVRFGAVTRSDPLPSQVQGRELAAPLGHKRPAERENTPEPLYRQRSYSVGSLHTSAVPSAAGRPAGAAASPQLPSASRRLEVSQADQGRANPAQFNSLEQLPKGPRATAGRGLMRHRSISADGAVADPRRRAQDEGSRRSPALRDATPAFTLEQR